MLKIFICCIFLVQVALGQVLRIVSDSLHEAKRLAVEDAPTDQAPSQPESPKVVYDAIPGTMFVGSGYDASKQYGTFENMRHDLIIKQGGDVSPDKIFNEKYLVPSNVDAFGIWKTFAETNSFSSEAEFISSLGNRVAGEGGGSCFGINVEASASFSSKKDKSSKDLKKTIVFETRVELFELVLQPNSLQENVAPVFKDLIKVALDKYNETKDAGVSERIKKMYEYYYYFFDACGTHYVKSAVLGGHLFIKIEASVQDQSEMNKIEAAASAYVSGLWGGGGASTSYSDESGEKKLQEKSVITFQGFGGDPLSGLVVNADNDMKTAFEFWLQTVPDKPNIARFTIDPIYNLLDKDSQVLYSDMKIAYEMYLKRVPPKGDNYFDLLPYVPSVWSSSNVLTTPGNGLITFDAVVSDSFSVQFATLPQSPVLKINFDVYKGCSFQIFQEQKNSITGILDLVVPKSVLTSFWIQLENGENLYVGFGHPPGHGSKPLYSKRNLASYRDLLSKVEFVGFTSSGSRATSLIGLNIQVPAHIYQKQFQTCQDYMNDHPSERGGLKTLIWHGFPVQIYCYKDNNDWKEYLELLVSATGVYKNIQNDFRYIRILPEYMATDQRHDDPKKRPLKLTDKEKPEEIPLKDIRGERYWCSFKDLLGHYAAQNTLLDGKKRRVMYAASLVKFQDLLKSTLTKFKFPNTEILESLQFLITWVAENLAYTLPCLEEDVDFYSDGAIDQITMSVSFNDDMTDEQLYLGIHNTPYQRIKRANQKTGIMSKCASPFKFTTEPFFQSNSILHYLVDKDLQFEEKPAGWPRGSCAEDQCCTLAITGGFPFNKEKLPNPIVPDEKNRKKSLAVLSFRYYPRDRLFLTPVDRCKNCQSYRQAKNSEGIFQDISYQGISFTDWMYYNMLHTSGQSTAFGLPKGTILSEKDDSVVGHLKKIKKYMSVKENYKALRDHEEDHVYAKSKAFSYVDVHQNINM
ncbi:hypothetical protein ROZALSC1DRAFT_22427 [Rozella allomycis CSF55]|uniref:MACPF domain-containing protein n=1 Tax=Rozella allomycis (strain CSF55) TaxID=988480 RepID=A0A4P9YI80_ROZAC|nr:hypothetical protein ROZALSC1DRAFT_22427 [Rozella allomycis CSF55]